MSNRKKGKTSVVSFGLAFLDCLCCGLGAATLLLLIVKHGPAEVAHADDSGIARRTQEVIVELRALESEIQRLESELGQSDKRIAEAQAKQRAQSSVQSSAAAQLAQLTTQLNQLRASLSASQADFGLAQDAQRLATQVPATEAAPKTGDVVGIEVLPTHVVVLLDKSASMVGENLVEILRRRASSPQTRINAPKWVSARGTAKWVYRQLPDGADYQILTYSDVVRDLGGKTYAHGASIHWLKKSATDDQTKINLPLNAVDPIGPTNMELALNVAGQLKPQPKQILLITDGLPSVPGVARLRLVKGCPSSRSQSGTVWLTPACRLSIFKRSVDLVQRRLPNTQVSVVMLPLEGDADSFYHYWQFAANTTGRVLTPATGWPYL